MFQNFVWYRTDFDSREYALSNQVGFQQFAPNGVTLFYTEPVNDGATPLGVNITVSYTLNDLSSIPERPNLVLHIDIGASTLTVAPLDIHIFAYNDLDLDESSGDDSAAAGGPNSRYSQAIRDANPHTLANYTASRQTFGNFAGSVQAFQHFEINTFPNLRNKLVNAAADDLSDTSAMLLNTDYTAGYQWRFSAVRNGDHRSVSTEIHLNMLPCPADIDRNGAVDVDDLIAVILGWGVCP
jgi:hypothetical protein